MDGRIHAAARLGRWHIFPGDDVGARNNLTRWLGLSEDFDYEGVRRILSQMEAIWWIDLLPSVARSAGRNRLREVIASRGIAHSDEDGNA